MPGPLDITPQPWTMADIKSAMTIDFMSVQDSIDNTDGGKLWTAIRHLDDTLWIFTTSTTELLDEISSFGERSKSIDFWHKTNEKNEERYAREVKRKLFYCTSALMTLVDISRNLGRKWPVDKSTEKRSEIFSTIGLHDFLQKLRNFSSHWRIAEADWVIKSKFETGERTAHFVIRRKELLKWGDWGASARKYLEELDEDPDIQKLFSEYKKQAQQYYAWHKGAIINQYHSILRTYFEYNRTHEGLRQYLKWNMILSHLPSNLNPYQYLAQYLSNTQIENILSYEHRSIEQIDAIIRMMDMRDFCDQQLKSKIIRVFGAK